MSAEEPTWEPPSPGQWFYSAEHLPQAVSTLYASIFPPIFRGWAEGAERYGLPPNPARFEAVHRFLYYSPGITGHVDVAALEQTAQETLATERWRDDLRTWAEETRPAVVADTRALLAIELEALDDAGLADHVDAAVSHFDRWAPQHFALMAVQGAAGGALFEAAAGWELDPFELFESLSHPAILARELGLTAVIGVPGLLDRVRDGDQVEVDPVGGTITVLSD